MPVEGTEYYDRDKRSKAAAAPGYYFQILFGLYFVEVISPLYFLLPRRWLERFRERYLPAQSVSNLLMQNWLGARIAARDPPRRGVDDALASLGILRLRRRTGHCCSLRWRRAHC